MKFSTKGVEGWQLSRHRHRCSRLGQPSPCSRTTFVCGYRNWCEIGTGHTYQGSAWWYVFALRTAHKTRANCSKETGKLLPCIIQDICYSDLDKQFLRSLDFTVVDDPDAFSLINANSLALNIGTLSKTIEISFSSG